MSIITRKDIIELVSKNNSHTYENVKDDIFPMNLLDFNEKDILPKTETLILDYKEDKEDNEDYVEIRDQKKFNEEIRNKLPITSDILRKFNNVAVAGGIISRLLNNDGRFMSSDIDIFTYGIKDPESATNNIMNIVEYINDTYNGYNFTIIKTNFALTIKIHDLNITIQFIFRLYNTMSEIIHGFDIPSCSVIYDGHNVYFTTMSYFAYKNNVNIVDVSRYSTTFEHRIVKYLTRGFSILFPPINPTNNQVFNNENYYENLGVYVMHGRGVNDIVSDAISVIVLGKYFNICVLDTRICVFVSCNINEGDYGDLYDIEHKFKYLNFMNGVENNRVFDKLKLYYVSGNCNTLNDQNILYTPVEFSNNIQDVIIKRAEKYNYNYLFKLYEKSDAIKLIELSVQNFPEFKEIISQKFNEHFRNLSLNYTNSLFGFNWICKNMHEQFTSSIQKVLMTDEEFYKNVNIFNIELNFEL